MSKVQKQIVIYIFLILGFIGCSKPQKESNKKINVTVSIVTYADFVKNIGGEKVNVNTMIPQNSNPHDYEPIPSQIVDLAKSDVYFKIGKYFDFEDVLLNKVKDVKADLKVVDCANGITFIDKDPHVWLGIDEVKIILSNIYNGLKEISPVDSAYFRKNYETYLSKINIADKNLSESFEKLTIKHVLVFHPAWNYFFKKYNLIQIGIEQHGKEPNAQDLKNILNFAKEKKIKVIYVEPQFNKDAATSIAEQIGASISVINNIPSDYLANLSYLQKTIVSSNL